MNLPAAYPAVDPDMLRHFAKVLSYSIFSKIPRGGPAELKSLANLAGSRICYRDTALSMIWIDDFDMASGSGTSNEPQMPSGECRWKGRRLQVWRNHAWKRLLGHPGSYQVNPASGCLFFSGQIWFLWRSPALSGTSPSLAQ
jgi:hypothetical protein